MAHIDPTTGSWEPDEDGPAPAQAGLIGEQAAPVPPPVPLPVTPPPQLPSVQLPEPQLPAPGGAPAGPALAPAAPPSPGVPAVQPYQPQAPQLPAVDRVVSPAERATLEAQDANTAARVGTEQQGGELDKATTQAKLDAAERDQQAHIDQEKDRQRIEAEFQKRIEAANAKAQADYQAYRQMGLKDPEAEQSFGHKVLAAIAIGLGQYSAGINGGSNKALDIIQAANAQNIALQKAAIDKKLQEAELSGKDAADVEKERADAYRRLDLKGSALLQASADKLKVELARIGVPAAQIAANADIQKLEADALQKREGAMESIRKDETILAKEDIAASVRRARALRAGGGGGATTALEKFAEAAGALKLGDPIPPEVAVLGRQAGLKPNQIAAEVDRYRGSGAKAAALEGRGEQQLSKEADSWAKQNGIAAISKQQRELSALQKELADNAHNPLQQALAVEKAVSAARGGAASKQALALALQHLGGSLDSAEAVIQKIKNGEISEGQMRNFVAFINGQRGAAQAEGKNAYDNFNKWVSTLPPDQQARALQSRSRVFSGLEGFGGSAAGGANPDKVALARKALADPNAPPAVKARAAEILKGLF